jgi:hypothetical protein
MSGFITYPADGTEPDLHNLTIGDQRVRDLPQHELYRLMRNYCIPVDPSMGHQQLVEKTRCAFRQRGRLGEKL